MYFSADDCRRILGELAALVANERSILWMDYVRPEIVQGRSRFRVVDDFREAMCSLGEPFIHGIGDTEAFLRTCSLVPISDVGSGAYQQQPSPLFDLYRFCCARPAAASPPA
jgi:hypothetical protein